jgi:hypothetical protein
MIITTITTNNIITTAITNITNNNTITTTIT